MSEFHSEIESGIDKWFNLIVLICGGVTAFLGGLTLLFWVLGFFNQITPGQKLIPMAEESAFLFLLFGSSLALYRKGLNNKAFHLLIDILVGFILLGSVFIFLDILTGNTLKLRNFLGMQAVMIKEIKSGIMSIVTVICFALLALALWMLQRKSKQVAVIFSSVTLLIGYIVIIGYAYGVPSLYGGSTIPMALNSAILIVISSIGLLAASGKESYPVKYFIGDSFRTRLLRILIPAVFILVQVQSFILSIYSGEFGSSFAVINGISSICVMLISGIIIFFISRSIGQSIDKNLADRKKAEEKMRESEEKFRSIFENNSSAIAIFDSDTAIVMVNDEYCRLSGYTREEVIGTSLTKQLPPEEHERLMDHYHRLLLNSTDTPDHYESEFFHRSGKIRHVVISVRNLGGGKILASFTDITTRRIEELKLAHLASLVESSNDIIISKTLDGIITSWNSGAEAIYGYTAEEMTGRPISVLTPPGMEDQITSILEKIRSGIVVNHFETVRQRKDGQIINVLISISPVKNRAGELIGASTIGHDITARKIMEKELKIKTEQLVKLNSEKDKFFSIIAHDLRSPFNGFLGLTETMANDLHIMTIEEVQEISRILNRSANNLYNLLGNLLEWSHMQRGFTSFNREPFLLGSKMSEILTLSIEAAIKKGIEIIFEIPEDLVVFADSRMFDSIIRNITNNAVKFTPRDGRITISAKSVSENQIEISVMDTGIGMSKELVDNLFLIDVNTSRKGTEGESSTGLGLIICKDFIEKHGGILSVESQEGKGTIFRFTLPNPPGE